MGWDDALGTQLVRAEGLIGVADGAAAHFGEPLGETRDLLADVAVAVPLLVHGAVVVTGADRIDFVNGQVSHDVRSLPEGGARLALLLDHKGRPQAGLTVVRRRDDLYLAIDDGATEGVHTELERHVVFDQVTVTQSASLVSFVVAGDDLTQRLGAVLGSVESVRHAIARPELAVTVPFAAAAVLVHARPRGAPRSVDVHARAAELPSLWSALIDAGVRPVGEIALAAARVDAGIAAAAAEGAVALPQEAGLDERISYRKGCYLGQEIMARIEARGTLRRGLARLILDAPPLDGAARSVVDADGRAVGQIGTAVSLPDGTWAALAVLRTDVPEGAVLHALGVRARRGASMRP